MGKIKDITGERFDRLVVQYRKGSDNRGESIWNCLCDCGNTKEILGSNLRKGLTKSCGCLSAELARSRRTTHGHSTGGQLTQTYNAWLHMTRRAREKPKGYEHVDIDAKWEESFESFLEDMGEVNNPSLSLDRIDPNKGYYKENCRWADKSTQAYNQRKQSNNTSGKTGVSLKENGKWQVGIGVEGKWLFLGIFSSFEEAVAIREIAEIEYHGQLKNDYDYEKRLRRKA